LFALWRGVFLGERVHEFYVRFLRGVHDLDDIPERRGLIRLDGQLQVRLFANLGEQFTLQLIGRDGPGFGPQPEIAFVVNNHDEGGIFIRARFVRLRRFRQREPQGGLLLNVVVTIKKMSSTMRTSINATMMTVGAWRRR